MKRELAINITINNVPTFIDKPYIVARLESTELWYFGAYISKRKAQDVAEAIDNGLVLELS